MSRTILTIVATIAIVQLSLQASLPTDPYYVAGVVEFSPSSNPIPAEHVTDNLNGYLEILNTADAQNLDIIVFPESTLNSDSQATFVPNPSLELVVPCDVSRDYHNILVQLSCAVKSLAKYVVINLTEKEVCSTVAEDNRQCAANGLNIYNTNVVFDRSGAIVSRYRKVNLYGENKNFTLIPEFGWFDTDFGVRFGHFICFDILFYTPAQEMAAQHGIKDFIFPTMWFSELPFLTAVQIQQSWSYSNDVNLLAAGASNPLVGSTGSGIFNGRRGILVAKMNQYVGERKLYVSQVPKYYSQRNLINRSLPTTRGKTTTTTGVSQPNIFLKRDYLQNYNSELVNLNSGNSLTKELCFNNTSFCCSFELSWQSFNASENSQHYLYRLGVFDGKRNPLEPGNNEMKNCAIFSCIGDDILDCGKVFEIDANVIFDRITITATFPKVKKYLLMPNSLKTDLMPLTVSNFEWHDVIISNRHTVRYVLNTTTSNLLAFSIYGNYFEPEFTDGKGIGDGAAALAGSLLVMLSSFVLKLIN